MPEVRLKNRSVVWCPARAQKRADERLDQLLRCVEKIARNTQRSALRQKEWLSETEVVWLLGCCETALRKRLNDLNALPHHPDKLNGYRLSKSRNSQWRFHQSEFQRFGPRLHGRNTESNGDAAATGAES